MHVSWVCSAAMDACLVAGQTGRARELYAAMVAQGLQPDTATYNSLAR